MRVLLTSGPVYSHFAPMIAPMAEAIRKAGHDRMEDAAVAATR